MPLDASDRALGSVLHVVALLTPENDYGGPVTVASELCSELMRRGVKTRIGAMYRGYDAAPTDLHGTPVVTAGCRSFGTRGSFSTLLSPRALYRVIRAARRSDVVHLHLARDSFTMIVGFFLAMRRSRYIVQTHGMLPMTSSLKVRIYDALLTKRVLSSAERILCLTTRESTELVAQFPTVADRLADLHNGLAITESRPETPFLERSGVVFAARLHRRKRPLAFVEAATALLDEGADHLTFELYGADEGELGSVRAAIPERWGDRITYGGAVPRTELQRILARAHLYVLPSVDEPYPMTVIEALAVGTPVICTSSCGLAEDIDSSNAGVVIHESASPQHLATAIRSLISEQQEWDAASSAAYELTATRFDIRTVVDRLISVYAGR